MVVGYCDSGCSNLDLALMDSFGEEVEADRLPDAEPILMFTAESTGNFEIRATAVECSKDRCNTAVGVLGSTDEPGMIPGEDMAGRLVLVGAEFTSLGFTEVGDERFGSLNSDQAIRLPIPMEAGREYRLAGVCDQDCFDLDLVLVDPTGNAVTSDRLEDAIPIVAHVADTTGDYQVEVIMIACALEPCAYRIASFAKGEKVGPGGTTLSGTLLSHETHQGELGAGRRPAFRCLCRGVRSGSQSWAADHRGPQVGRLRYPSPTGRSGRLGGGKRRFRLRYRSLSYRDAGRKWTECIPFR